MKARRLLLIAALGLAAAAPKCPPVPQCPAGQHLALVGAQLTCLPDPHPSPEPIPSATPAPTPDCPVTPPPPTPEPSALPVPTATPAPAPTPFPQPVPTVRPTATPPPTPVPTVRPTPDTCIREAAEVAAYQLRQGHLTARSATLWCNEDGRDGPVCHDPRTGDRIDPVSRAVLVPGWRWWGTCDPGQPAPTPQPTATPAPLPPGAHGCSGVQAARIGLNFSKAPGSKPGCTFDKTSLRVDGDCILVADASVRGPRGSDNTIPSTEAHLGWLPGCWYVVRPRWEQQHADDLAVDIGVRHWRQDDPATSVAARDVTEPPYAGAEYGSLARFQFNFQATVRLRACWPPDVADPVCSDWYEVTHR